MTKLPPKLIEIIEFVNSKPNIFNFDYSTDNITNKREFENNFILKYGYYRIGYFDIDEFKHALEYQLKITYNNYVKKRNALDKDFDIENTNKVNVKTVMNFIDTPTGIYYTDNDYSTSKTLTDHLQTERNKDEIDIAFNYTQKLNNIKKEYIDSFKNLFLKVYD